MAILEAVELGQEAANGPFRFPVQLVCRPRTEAARDFRGYQGRVESGSVAVGDAVTVLPSGEITRVAGIAAFGEQRLDAVCGESVTLLLEDDLDLSRGDLVADRACAPVPTQEVAATVCWLDARLLLRHGTRLVRAVVSEVIGRLDLQTQTLMPARELQSNDIATVRLRLAQPIAPDPYAQVRTGGAFILIDETTHATVAAGMVLDRGSSAAGADA